MAALKDRGDTQASIYKKTTQGAEAQVSEFFANLKPQSLLNSDKDERNVS